MTLSVGTKLGPYEIQAPLGAGGMGEVYRARDTWLERSVAVKVLPQHLSSSAEVRQRFEREAKTISQLSHPHVCALYDVGREGEVEYLVMELLEGETLSERLVKGVPADANFDYGTWRGVFSVSQDRVLVYQTAQEQARGQLQWMDPSGHVGTKVGEPNNSYALRLSPDGTRASVIEGDPNSDLWIYELDRGFRTRLTTNEQVILTPIWTHDGSEILYVSGTSATVGSDYTLLRRPSLGGGKAVEVTRSKARIEPTDLSPDGRYLVVDRGPIGSTAIWLFPLADPGKASALMDTPGLQTDGRVSPDGRWMSFTQLQGGRLEVFVVAFPAGTGRQQVSPSGGSHARWSPDGRTLYFISQDNELMAAAVEPAGSQLRIKSADPLFRVQLFTGPRVSGAFEITPDGKRFLMNSSGNVEAPSIRVVTNWTPEPEKP